MLGESPFVVLGSQDASQMGNAGSKDGPRLELLIAGKLYSTRVNALIAMAKKDGPALLAAWHRDRRATIEAGKGAPDAEA